MIVHQYHAMDAVSISFRFAWQGRTRAAVCAHSIHYNGCSTLFTSLRQPFLLSSLDMAPNLHNVTIDNTNLTAIHYYPPLCNGTGWVELGSPLAHDQTYVYCHSKYNAHAAFKFVGMSVSLSSIQDLLRSYLIRRLRLLSNTTIRDEGINAFLN